MPLLPSLYNGLRLLVRAAGGQRGRSTDKVRKYSGDAWSKTSAAGFSLQQVLAASLIWAKGPEPGGNKASPAQPRFSSCSWLGLFCGLEEIPCTKTGKQRCSVAKAKLAVRLM